MKTERNPGREPQSGPDGDEREPAVHDPDGVGKERASSAGASGSSTSLEAARAEQPLAQPCPCGQPVYERQERVRIEREETVGGGHEHAPGDPAELREKLPLSLPAPGDVLDHRVRETEVERPVGEGEAAPVRAHRAHARERGGETVELGLADRGDALGPRVARLEEVVARAAPEGRVGHPDVEHRCLGARSEELEEEAELAFPAAKRHAQRRPRVKPSRERSGAGGARSCSARAGATYAALRPPAGAARHEAAARSEAMCDQREPHAAQ